jgi:transcription initiation factor TFIIIB Brf1 subunit/transcription initiation factor TFIIB
MFFFGLMNNIDFFLLKPRFRKNLQLEQGMIIEKTAIHIAEQAKQICDIEGRKPSSIAGASIYLACMATRENVSKKGKRIFY